MARRNNKVIVRKGQGFRVNLEPDEIMLLRRLVGELRMLLVGPADDPRLIRLFPTAYHKASDRELDQEYQRLMREELVVSRLSGIAAVDEAFEMLQRDTGKRSKVELTQDHLTALMQAINGLRLVLGSMLDVGEEHDLDDMDDSDPSLPEHRLYTYLSWILECCVEAIQSS